MVEVSDSGLAVRMVGISKRYPAVVANRDAHLEVRRGEVHAVVGENGAGKSTLMKILAGVVSPDSGEIEVLGKKLRGHNARQAIAAGLGMVFQHFVLVPPLSVAANVVLGHETRKGPFFDVASAEQKVRAISESYGLPIDPRQSVESCSVGLQQRVEILKVLYRGAEILIFDEPTAVLTPQEADELIGVMRRLVSTGKTVLLITHKLREVMAASDRVTVMRRGETVATLETKNTSSAEIAELMVGRALKPPSRPAARTKSAPILEVRGLSARSTSGRGIAEVGFAVERGEIVGIAGIEGNGQTELIECIAGLLKPTAGEIVFDGASMLGKSVRERYDLGLAHVPEDRHRRAVVLDFSVTENAILGLQHRRELAKSWGLDWGRARALAEAIIRKTDLRPPEPMVLMRQLSGGNQQKLVIGREISKEPKLLIACHPTRGLDVGASEFVLETLVAARDRGAGVLFVSAELTELLAVSDRILVMFGGRFVGEADPTKVDEAQLGLWMAGQAA